MGRESERDTNDSDRHRENDCQMNFKCMVCDCFPVHELKHVSDVIAAIRNVSKNKII